MLRSATLYPWFDFIASTKHLAQFSICVDSVASFDVKLTIMVQ